MPVLPIQEVYQGDCLQILPSLPNDHISACITDPPYNYEFVGRHWDHQEIIRRTERVASSSTLVKNLPYGSGLAGGVRNARWYERNYANARSYRNWCTEWGQELYRICKPGALVVAFNSARTMAHMQVGLEEAGFYARDTLVYRRPSGIPKGVNMGQTLRKHGAPDAEQWIGWHSCLRAEWEAIVVVQKPIENNYMNNLQKYGLGLFHAQNDNGRFQGNILEGYHTKEKQSFNIHCTVKPLSLMTKLIDLFVPPGPEHTILDPFAGSGTTLVAAQTAGRGYIGIEVVPEYIEIIHQRLHSAASKPVALTLW